MTYLGRRHSAGRQDDPVKLQAFTIVDRKYKVDAYSSIAILWENLPRMDLFFNPYGNESITKNGLHRMFERCSIVHMYERDCVTPDDWYWQIESHK